MGKDLGAQYVELMREQAAVGTDDAPLGQGGALGDEWSQLPDLPCPTAEPCGWIPIREESSPPAPFDVASARMLHVPRYEDGTLDEDALRQQLTDRIEGMLHQA